MARTIGWTVCLFLAASVMMPLSAAADETIAVVGRIYEIEGDLLRYVPEERDWVAVVKDAPFSTEDALFSGDRGRAELIVPNGTWIRMGDNTQIQFIAVERDLSEIDVAFGMARFYNKGADAVIKAASPFGYVLAEPGAVFDFYVGENAVEVVILRGRASFIHSATDARYDVSTGAPSILADERQVSPGDDSIDPDWNRWNATRENYWAVKARSRGRSVQYLPPSLHDESYVLDENGRWEKIPYEGSSHWFWRPRVVVGWSPFTMGRWTDWNGDQTWIPAEPFGYVTHHYGNWVYVRNSWYWAPPVVNVRVGLPLLDIGFFWSPGRVSWIHSGAYVGWVPLAPRETYYSHRNWGGPHGVVVTNVSAGRINISIGSYAYAARAVVVPRDNFYRVNNYRNVRVANIKSTTIINHYRAAPVVNDTVINNYTKNKRRYNYTNAAVKGKPHHTVINRIEKNAPVIQRSRKESAVVVQQRVKNIKHGTVNREARIEAPRVTKYIVPAAEVNRPKSEIKLHQKDIKTHGRTVQREKSMDRRKEMAPPAIPTPKAAPPERRATERRQEVRPAEKSVEQPREVKQPERTLERSKVAPPERK
ncbi:MAG: hypothetical protein JW943_17455, partial [Deltaproteobacteria bacterium]|nr:hypothetical protein [Deltaproteobacteria bacterium]